jgi:hypothetical protein
MIAIDVVADVGSGEVGPRRSQRRRQQIADRLIGPRRRHDTHLMAGLMTWRPRPMANIRGELTAFAGAK